MVFTVMGRAPALDQDRGPLQIRSIYDYADYGFTVRGSLNERFEIIPIRTDDAEAFVFFYPKDDLQAGRFSLLNFHAFLKRTGSLEDFAHSLGPSVASIALTPTRVLDVEGLTYERVILMRDLFAGAPEIIDFIGGRPDLTVFDSHTYFRHRFNHYYTGLLHEPGDEVRYRRLRTELFAGIRLI